MVIFLFGKPGVGKSTVGQKLAGSLAVPFIDCDSYYTEDDKVAIFTNEFTFEMSDEFLSRSLEGLRQACEKETLLIASQSLFQEKHRRQLKESFGFNVFLVYLEAPERVVTGRLAQRTKEGEHFYSLEQYNQEVEEYEEVVTADLVVENTGNIGETIEKIQAGFVEYYQKIPSEGPL